MKLKIKKSFLEVRNGRRYVAISSDEWFLFVKSLRRARELLRYISKFTRVRSRSRRTQNNNEYKIIAESEFNIIKRLLQNPIGRSGIEDVDFLGFYHAIRDRDTQLPPSLKNLGEKVGVSEAMAYQWYIGKKSPSLRVIKCFYELYPKIAPKFFVDPDIPRDPDIKAFMAAIDDTPYRVSKRIKVTPATVYSWLNNGRTPHITQLRKLIKVYGEEYKEILLPYTKEKLE